MTNDTRGKPKRVKHSHAFIATNEQSPLIKELSNTNPSHYSTEFGYYLSRGLDPTLAKIHKTDLFGFFEPVHNQDHKKCPIYLDETGEEQIKSNLLGSTFDNFIGLYKGTLACQRSVVAEGFQWYSCLVALYNLHLARASRLYDCPPDTMSILAAPNVPAKTKQDLNRKRLALRYVAFIVYEGYGLSGYSPKLWIFFSLITGQGTYTLPRNKKDIESFVSDSLAKEFKDALAEYEEQYLYDLVHAKDKKQIVNNAYLLFRQQWLLLDKNISNIFIHDEANNKVYIGELLIKELYNAWALTNLYRSLERGVEVVAPEVDKEVAVLAGFTRRSAKGRLLNRNSSTLDIDFSSLYLDEFDKQLRLQELEETEGKDAVSPDNLKDLFVPIPRKPNPLFGYMQEYWETRRGSNSLWHKLTDNSGGLCPFGLLVDNMYESTKARLMTVREIAHRAKVLQESQGDIATSLIRQWAQEGARFRL